MGVSATSVLTVPWFDFVLTDTVGCTRYGWRLSPSSQTISNLHVFTRKHSLSFCALISFTFIFCIRSLAFDSCIEAHSSSNASHIPKHSIARKCDFRWPKMPMQLTNVKISLAFFYAPSYDEIQENDQNEPKKKRPTTHTLNGRIYFVIVFTVPYWMCVRATVILHQLRWNLA